MEENTTKQPGQKYCHSCGKTMSETAVTCPHCGAMNPLVNGTSGMTEMQSKRIAAGLLAILLGAFGVYKFYLGDTSMGILYLCFFWTGIPAIIGIIEGVIYLTQTDAEFAKNIKK